MAFLPEDPNAQNQNQAPAGGQSGSMASQAPITSSPAPAGGGTSGKTINQASSSAPAQPFTNLQAYLTANAPQLEQQGQQIAGTLNNQYGATTGAIDAAKTSFGDQVKAGYTPNDQQVVNNFSVDPTKVASDPNAAKTFTGMLSDTYKGPGSFESGDQYGSVNDQVLKGQATAKQLSSQNGVQSYLMGQNPSETQGMATLDSSLLSANPGAVTTVQNAAKQFDQLPSYLTNAVNQGNTSVQSAIAEANAAKAAAGTAFDTQSTGLAGNVDAEYQKAIQDAQGQDATYNDIIARLGHVMPTGYDDGVQSLTNGEQSALGVSNDALNKYAQANQILEGYNNGGELSRFVTSGVGNADVTPLSSYLSGGKPSTLPTDKNTVASAHDFEIAKALATLGGDKYQSPLDPSKEQMAGTYQPGGSYQNFDTTKANGLFDQVKQRDQLFGDDFIKNTPGLQPGDYATALTQLQKGDPGNLQGGAALTLAALNRLANGFGAPQVGYTPAPITPTLGGGLNPDGTPITTTVGGGHVAR